MGQVIYYAICGVGWIAAGALGFWLMRAIQHLRRQTGRERWAIALLIVLVLAVLGVNYVLTYPLAVSRLRFSAYESMLDLFVPAEWLYDHTPLRGAMRQAGEAAGVAADLDAASRSRMTGNYWGSAPPALYAAGWLAFAGVIVCCGTWLALRMGRLASGN